MATYNGEQYIGEQLQSLADQAHVPFELIIGDDCSSDATLNIIDDFCKRAPFPVRVHSNDTNLGYARNFLAIAKRCQGEWIAFCDQDDIWLSGKLAESVAAIERTPHCCMVLQNAWLCDSALVSIGRSFPNWLPAGVHERASQYGFWVWPGFLKTISKEVINLFCEEDLPRSWFRKEPELTHDKWTCLVANALGGIVVLDKPVAMYRRHDRALTGNYSALSVSERVAKARSVSGKYYDFLDSVAEECANYMVRLSDRTDNAVWSVSLKNNSIEFKKLAAIQRLRAKLYGSPYFIKRLHNAIGIASKGGYIGPNFHAMGVKSFAKDAMRVVFGSHL